jgi:hypothetical protein
MVCNRRSEMVLLGCFALLSLLPAHPSARSIPRQDSAWKRYHNEQWGYCVSYPSRWLKGDAFDGAGIFVRTGVKKYSLPLGEIDVGVIASHSDSASLTQAVSLADDFRLHLNGLKKFVRAERIEILEQRPMEFLGSPALFTKERYYDPLERRTWVDEVVFVHRSNVLYRLELECRADQLERFEPVFTRFVSTFQFDCSERR